jgi:hypothetical protein
VTAEALAFYLSFYDLTEEATVEVGGDREGFMAAALGPHEGDCTGLPAPCTRCFYEKRLKAARRLMERYQ